MTTTPEDTQSRVRYVAHFTPEAWVDDNAVEVDAEGEQEWDCTRAVTTDHADYFAKLTNGKDYHGETWDDGEVLDNDDVLRDDPDAPEWVRNWQGPFSIHVTRQVPDDT